MEGQLREALTFPAENYTGSFFKRLPSDSRFLQNSYTKFGPAGSIQDKTIEFCLDRYDAANIYLIQFATVIVKENGSLPSTDALVAPVNNVVHSLFESVRLIINDKPLTSSAGNYPYKAYITNCLTYSTVVKYSQLKCEGYYEDTSKIMGPSENNVGFIERNNLFRHTPECDIIRNDIIQNEIISYEIIPITTYNPEYNTCGPLPNTHVAH